MTANPRVERIAAQMRRALATLLRRGVKDPRVGNVTVTDVDLAPDLSNALVRVLPFGAEAGGAATDAAQGEQLLAGLRSAAGFLRGALARELALRRAPRLEFELDRHLENAHQLSELIDRAVAADAQRARPPAARAARGAAGTGGAPRPKRKRPPPRP